MGGSAEPTIDAYRGPVRPVAASGPSSTAAGLERTPWFARLRRALREERFVLHYQPIVSLSDGRVAHHEALVRLLEKRGGTLIEPARFLPAAERSGVIREIDRAVLDKALATIARERGESIAVNLSALSLSDPLMLAFLRDRLARHGVAGASLVLEVTETASISDMAQARTFCEGASELGCAIALDDFGAGFGSFHYLRHLPFSYLKIDGSFIRGLARSARDRRVVGALVALARGMGARTVAEYVQDADTLELLPGLGVDYAQGFAVGRPGPALSA
jgi:EAL domain-containing protein (putative c-di-GMP-specific phosphodiesterase class I)